MEMYQSGELQQTLGVEAPPEPAEPPAAAEPAPAPPLSIENRL
jgi:hypothetical protein